MRLFLFVALVVICLGCKVPKQIQDSSTQSDFRISMNHTFVVELASNPSTGYKWQWANERNVINVELLQSDFIADYAANTGVVGSGGTEKLTFKAVKKGVSVLELVYVRPWEQGAPPAKTKSYRVEVY